jgi:hypothetical protein
MILEAVAVIALVWGVVWALALQSRPGRFLAARYTWITVVIGVGVDLLIALLIVPLEDWLKITAVIALSSIGIIVRSLFNEHQDQKVLHTMLHGDEDAHSQ